MEVATDRYTRIRFGLGTVKGESSLYLWNLLDTYKKNVYFMLQNEIRCLKKCENFSIFSLKIYNFVIITLSVDSSYTPNIAVP